MFIQGALRELQSRLPGMMTLISLAIVVAFIPIVGTALAGVLIVIAAVAAIVSALANITLAATGERSWAEAGIAIAHLPVLYAFSGFGARPGFGEQVDAVDGDSGRKRRARRWTSASIPPSGAFTTASGRR